MQRWWQNNEPFRRFVAMCTRRTCWISRRITIYPRQCHFCARARGHDNHALAHEFLSSRQDHAYYITIYLRDCDKHFQLHRICNLLPGARRNESRSEVVGGRDKLLLLTFEEWTDNLIRTLGNLSQSKQHNLGRMYCIYLLALLPKSCLVGTRTQKALAQPFRLH